MNSMLVSILGLMQSELGVSGSTIDIVLTVATATVIVLPLLFVVRSKKDFRKITL